MWLLSKVATAIFYGIGTSMWVWMQAYVKLQELTYGDTLFVPNLRAEPTALTNPVFGEHKFLNITNVTVHYVTRGCEDQGRPMLILLHGFLDFWFVWDRQIPELSKEFCVVAPDMRGYGQTSKPPDSADYLMRNLVEDVKSMILNLRPQKEAKGSSHRTRLGWNDCILFHHAT